MANTSLEKANSPRKVETTSSVETQKSTQEPSLLEVMNRLAAVEKENQILKGLQDPRSYNDAVKKIQGDTRTRVRLRTIDGKYIKSWSNMIHNDVRIVNGQEVANQVIEVFYEDGEPERMSIKEFRDRYTLTSYLPVETEEIGKNGRYFVVIREDGSEFRVRDTFVN